MTRLAAAALFGISLVLSPQAFPPAPNPAFAQSPAEQARDFREAMKAFKAGNYAPARLLLEKLSNEGFPPAQYNLGLMLAKGLGTRADLVEAYKWFKLARDGGVMKGEIAISKIRPRMSQSDFAEAVARYDAFRKNAGK